MEGGDQNLGNGGSRWNPTKEQISMLESLYKQGLRTPTAEQIQQITSRLREFGHIEGKNVFYWFQNHKARQRQKQKQESFAFYNRFLHATPVFPPYQNVVCSPCYIPPPKVPLPTASASFKKFRLIPENIETNRQNPPSRRCNTKSTEYPHFISSKKHSSRHHQETLDLFPIHPTGVLQSSRNGIHENENPMTFCANIPSVSNSSENDETDGNINGCDDDEQHQFFDFFRGN